MARKSAVEEMKTHLDKFFTETKAGIMKDVQATRQPSRRTALLAQLDAFDKVEGRYYHWMTSQSPGGDKS